MATSGVLVLFMAVIGVTGILNLGSVNDAGRSLYQDRTVPIAGLGKIAYALEDAQRLTMRAILYAGDAADFQRTSGLIAQDDQIVNQELAAFKATQLLESEKGPLADLEAALADYRDKRSVVLAEAQRGNQEAAKAANDPSLQAWKQADGALSQLIQINTDQAKAANEAIAATFESGRTVTLAVMLVAMLVGFGLSFWVGRGIVGGLRTVQRTLTSLADDGATPLAEALGRLAANDLTAEVTVETPAIGRYGADEIGETARVTDLLRERVIASVDAYNRARADLARTVAEVKAASDEVAATAKSLDAAAGQTGAAVGQVTTTIGQVAAGAADQARAASETSAAVAELSGVIAQVGQGAAQTSAKVEEAAATVNQMSVALEETSAASREVGEVATSAAQAAQRGAEAVRDTISGMARIREAVAASRVKVADLGAKGEQIGAIVETIDDIAEQTNLLALNAAIEAARAGEMGKGFAVVADEVRKLAERSGRATKEIAELIREVQAGTQEAVRAMEAGASEVEAGSQLAGRSGAALDELAAGVAATQAAVARITGAVERMSAAASGVVAAMEAIARVAEANAAAATQMTANAGTVSRAVESIAAVSEENSAAAQEVSAATEEMSAQVQETVAAAQSLAQMAARLDELMARFRLAAEDGRGDETVVYRRRASDWRRQVA
jgi:methyl-accepting chemotaxis protein